MLQETVARAPKVVPDGESAFPLIGDGSPQSVNEETNKMSVTKLNVLQNNFNGLNILLQHTHANFELEQCQKHFKHNKKHNKGDATWA